MDNPSFFIGLSLCFCFESLHFQLFKTCLSLLFRKKRVCLVQVISSRLHILLSYGFEVLPIYSTLWWKNMLKVFVGCNLESVTLQKIVLPDVESRRHTDDELQE